MTTLYRKYRPAVFREITGQNQVTDILRAAVAKDKLTHAYLFHGPRGTGKTTTARILAKRINCQQAVDAEPCGQCPSCLAAANGSQTDIIEIDAASNRGIDDIRELRERITTVPILSRYKVYIIDEVHMLTGEAAAALLKTLEEPVKHAIFILATTEIHKVLPTILSRCQVFRFRRATADELIGRLKFVLNQENRQADDDVLELILERADGCYRDAESLLGQLLTLNDETLRLDAATQLLGLPPKRLIKQFLDAMQAGESAPAVASVDEAFNEGVDPEQFLQESVRHARDLAIKDITAGQTNNGRWPEIIRALLQAVADLAFVPEPIIALHLAILTVCSARERKTSLPVNPVKPVGDKKVSPHFQEGGRGGGSISSTISSSQTQDVQKITAVWPQLISVMKTGNPVASTFLRAVEPVSFSGENITIRTKYSLHNNFLDNPKIKLTIKETLSKLLNQPITLRFILDENNQPMTATLADQRQQQEEKFYQTVKEVFEG